MAKQSFSFGVLAAWADAEQQLNAPGAGSTEIDADTYGVYATWLSNGFAELHWPLPSPDTVPASAVIRSSSS